MIDRITPTKRPAPPLAGNQRWRDLLFVHWPIDKDLIQKQLPKGLEVDCFDNQAYIGIVPFMMFDVRPWWLPKFMAFNFLETNLRTYVHYKGMPGVYFFSLDAASWLAVQAARIGWSLPYYYAKMNMEKTVEQISYSTIRKTKHKSMLKVEYQPTESVSSTDTNGLEFFLAERYHLFTKQGKHLYQGQVHHTPYPLQAVKLLHLEQTLIEAAGLQVEQPMPTLAHYSSGVDVDIFPLQIIHTYT